jgi:hypothetical protein
VLGAVFFGLCAAKILIQALQGGPRIIISDLGIDDQRNGLGLIRWEDIQAVWIQKLGSEVRIWRAIRPISKAGRPHEPV